MIVATHFDKGNGVAASGNPFVVIIRCGEDYETDTFVRTVIVQIQCPLYNGTDTAVTIYKDGVKSDHYNGVVQFGPVPRPSDDIFGTYTFVAENNCSRDVAVTRITRKGLYMCTQSSHAMFIGGYAYMIHTSYW